MANKFVNFIMASGGRISKNIKQGKVEIDYEDCALLVNYDQEMVRITFFAAEYGS